MSERISGLSIDLSMDSAGITRSMTDIKNTFRDLKRSAQVNLNNIKFDSKDVNTYKKNLNELSKSFDNQKKNVNDLKKNYDMLVETQGEGSKEAQAARIEYNKQADELNKLGHALDEAKDGMQELYVESSKFKAIETGLENISSKMQTVGDGITTVGKSMTAAITAPVLGAITASIKSFADLEQAVGGVETLFKDSADTVIKNSETAYKRAGVSGVDYMENVTSFSATLLQGLEGDTEAAAKAADMAMVDMSDNANKFGTNIGDIQNAYQGFAKDNFTMLDNLKLGYGGTAGEMARLINESGVLGDSMEVTAETVKDVPFDKMIEAIHEVQTEMGVTGTTVKEAEETVSGSFGMMKASFQDLAAGFGQEGANIEGLFENLWSSVGAFTDNIKRVLGDIWNNLPMDEWQKWAGAIGVAAGPILIVLGTIISSVGKVIGAFAPLFGWLAKLSGGFKTVYSGVKPFAVVFPKLAGLISIITGPIGLTVAAIVGLGAAFVLAYQKSETFRDFIAGLGDMFRGAWETAMELKDNLVTAFQGIFAIFQGDHTRGNSLLRSIGLSEETIDKIFLAVFHIQNAFTTIKNYVMQALGAVTTFVQEKISQIVGFWQTDGQQILQAVSNIFNGISTVISAAMNFIMPFIKLALNGILNIFKVVWPAVLFVVQMVWENIKGVINGGLNIIKGLVQVFSGIFTGDFSKMWEGVKNIFSGAIQFVWNLFQLMFWGRIVKGLTAMTRGAIGIVRNLWTTIAGFFRNMADDVALRIMYMRDGAVRIFTNIRTSLTNIVSNLNTRINKFIRNMVDTVILRFMYLWDDAVRIFNRLRTSLTTTVGNLRAGVSNRISDMVSAVVRFFTNLLTRGRQIFNNLRTSLVTTIGNLRMGVSNRISDMVSAVIRFFQNLLGRGREIFTSLRTSVTDRISAMREGVVSGVSRMRDRAVEIYQNLKKRASELLTDMVDGAKKLPGRIGEGISNMKSKAVSGIKSLGNSMIGKLGEVVNGVIKGLNSITSKIGISATIDKWDVPTFSTGTGQGSPTGNLTRNGKIAMDTLATVGDKGPGNGPGTRELVHYPNGKVGLYDNNATIFAPKGTTIYSNQETEALLGMIPRFSKGTGLWDRITNIASKAVDYITNPSKIFEDLISAVSGGFEGLNGFMMTMAKGAFNFLKDKFLSWITDRFSESTVGTKQSWMDYRMTTPYSPNAPVPGYPKAFNGGRHYGIDYATPIGVNITAPFAGTVKKQHDVGGGTVARLENGKAAQYFLHMSSVKPGTVGVGESVGKSGNSGLFTTGAHVHWQHEEPAFGRLTNKNTKNPLKQIESHMLGGLALTDGLINVHKGEYIINPNHPTEAMKLIALAGKKVAAKSKQTRELPNPGNYGDSRTVEVLLEIADNQQKQIDQLTQFANQSRQMIAHLAGIENKTGYNPAEALRANNRYTDDRTLLT